MTYFQRVSGGYLLALICLMVLSGVVTYVVCQYQNQTIRLRNQFLEQRYKEQMKNEVDARQPTRQPVKDSVETERIYESRDGKLLTKIYWSPNDYGLDVETIDLDTKVVKRHSENDYFKLIKRVEGLFSNSLESVFLLTRDSKQYAVIDTYVGNVDVGDGLREIYVATFEPIKESLTIKSFSITPVSAKTISISRAYGRVEILDYFPQQNQIITISRSSDGCGGMGSVELLSVSIQNQVVKEVGMGCVTQTRYLGYLGNLLYFGEIDLTDEDLENWEDAKIINIFSLNPLTKERKNLSIDLSTHAFDTTWVDVTNKISATELVLFDKTTEEGYALDVKTLELRNLGKLYD